MNRNITHSKRIRFELVAACLMPILIVILMSMVRIPHGTSYAIAALLAYIVVIFVAALR